MATEVISEFVNLNEKPLRDTSISNIEYYETKISDPNGDQNPRFTIDYTDQWVLPCEAYLQLTGKLVKNDNTDYAADDNVAFVNNGPLHMFDRALYKIDNQAIETIEKPGEATMVMSLVDYSNDYVDMMGDQLMIAKDTGDNNTAAGNTGHTARKAQKKFDLCIPLSHIFRFAKDIRKVFYGMTHSVELVRSVSSDNAIMRADATDAGKIKFTNISLWMPRVTPSPASETKLLKFMDKKQTVYTPFQQLKYFDKAYDDMRDITWDISNFSKTDRPRHVFIGFRLRDKEDDQEQNNAVFDPCGVTDISLVVNGEVHPRFPYTIDFGNGQVGRPFRDLLNYRGVDNKYDSGMLITKGDFVKRYPIFHFDLEKMAEPLDNSTSTIQLRARLNAGGNYRVHAVILADRDLSFTADGKRMNVSHK